VPPRVGREKDGKSTLAAYAAARVSDGGQFVEGPCLRGPVVWIGMEEHDTPRGAGQLVQVFSDRASVILQGEAEVAVFLPEELS
jgi:hypothetical protein